MHEFFDLIFSWPYSIFLIRLLPTLIIFRWNLLGSFMFIYLDTCDYDLIRNATDSFSMDAYQMLDKIFDLYYLSILCIIIVKDWKNSVLRGVGTFLYLYRLVGTFLFEITGSRVFLIIFTNIFELYFDFVLILKGFIGKIQNPWKSSLWIMILLLPIKAYQELYIHSDLDIPMVLNDLGQMLLGLITFALVLYLELFRRKQLYGED